MSTFNSSLNSSMDDSGAGSTFNIYPPAIIHDDQQKLQELIESDFDPDKSSQYELADIKLQFNQLLSKVFSLAFNYPDTECLGIFNSTKSLQAVSRMFQELIRVNLADNENSGGESLIQERYPPMAHSTPDRQLRFNDTFTRVFPGHQLNSTFSQPRMKHVNFTRGDATYTARPENATFTKTPLNATFTRSPNRTFTTGAENLTFDVSPHQRNPFIPQIVIETPIDIDERLSNSARSLNQTVAQLANTTTPPQSQDHLNPLNVPSQTRATMTARAQSRLPKFKKAPRKIDFRL